MSCLTKLITRPVNNCINLLTVGSVSENNTIVIVLLKNTATGRTDWFSATTDGSGIVTIDLANFELIPNSTYLLEVTKESGESYQITIDGNTTNAILMPVEIINGVAAGDVTLVEA